MSEQQHSDHNLETHNSQVSSDAASYYWLGLVGMVSSALGLIVCGILYFQNRDKSAFQRHHLSNVVNFFLTLLLIEYAVTFILIGSSMFAAFRSLATAGQPDPTALSESIGNGFYYTFLIKGASWLAIIMFCITGGTRARDGKEWYPKFLIPAFS